MTKFRI